MWLIEHYIDSLPSQLFKKRNPLSYFLKERKVNVRKMRATGILTHYTKLITSGFCT